MKYAIFIQREAEQAEQLLTNLTHEEASTALARIAVAFGH
jgi:hypothetical protein